MKAPSRARQRLTRQLLLKKIQAPRQIHRCRFGRFWCYVKGEVRRDFVGQPHYPGREKPTIIAKTDVYVVGAIIHELATGERVILPRDDHSHRDEYKWYQTKESRRRISLSSKAYNYSRESLASIKKNADWAVGRSGR